ncbi:hypothetical protein BYT27DRAFT_7253112 [Phlegmacium glaucopus]|nr:hypothetical protein BYT27DRAFT_7253112 [Phlegmacium glaucopus]
MPSPRNSPSPDFLLDDDPFANLTRGTVIGFGGGGGLGDMKAARSPLVNDNHEREYELDKGLVSGLVIGPSAAPGSDTTLIAVLPPPTTGPSTSSTVSARGSVSSTSATTKFRSTLLHLHEVLSQELEAGEWGPPLLALVSVLRPVGQMVPTVQIVQAPENHNDNHPTRHLPFHFIKVVSNCCSKSLAKAANTFLKFYLGNPVRSASRQKVETYCRIGALIFLRRSASFSNNTFHAGSDIPRYD